MTDASAPSALAREDARVDDVQCPSCDRKLLPRPVKGGAPHSWSGPISDRRSRISATPASPMMSLLLIRFAIEPHSMTPAHDGIGSSSV